MVRSETSTEQRILEIAADQIRSFGPARATIVSIADAAHMSHANVYRYYPSKRALFDEVTAAWLRPVESSIRVISDSPDPAYDKLERILFCIHKAYREKFEDDQVIFALFSSAVIEGRGVARKHRNRLQTEVQRVLEEGMSGGVFPVADLRKGLALVFDALHRFTHPVAVQLDRDVPKATLEQRFQRVTGLVIRALTSGRY